MNAIHPSPAPDLLARRRATVAADQGRLITVPGLTLLIRPGVPPEARIAAARALLAGTGHRITEEPPA